MPGIKYALMLLPLPADESGETFDLGGGAITWVGKLADLIERDQVGSWREWLGSMTWEALTGTKRLVFVSMPSEQPRAADGGTKKLEARLDMAWFGSLLTSRVLPMHGQAYVIGGEAKSAEVPVRLLSINGVSFRPKLPRPFYLRRTAYTKAFGARYQWREADANWLTDWRAATALLSEAGTVPLLLHVALTTFQNAFMQDRIDFRVPTFVRAAECILAVPSGGGRAEFARRALRLAPGLAQHWFVGGDDLEERLRLVYVHRNECVHGKLPFPELYDGTHAEQATDDAVRCEYLAEAIAREALLTAFRDPSKFAEFATRDRLEDVWAKNRFP